MQEQDLHSPALPFDLITLSISLLIPTQLFGHKKSNEEEQKEGRQKQEREIEAMGLQLNFFPSQNDNQRYKRP
jgi:hypothetical protein